MKRILSSPLKWMVLSISLIVCIISGVMFLRVDTNFDMSIYLPEDSNTAQGLDVLEETFGNHAVVQVMILDITVEEVLAIKSLLLDEPSVMTVQWLDDIVDLSVIPIEVLDPELVQAYYVDGQALLTIVFHEDAYHLETGAGIINIRALLEPYTIHMRGEAINNIESRRIAENETFKLLFIIIPICFVILLLASKSWVEPFVLLITLGIGVIINMGTNAWLPHVSFITMTIAAALQLAISLDYSLFVTHRYYEEREDGHAVNDAIVRALKRAFPAVTASALTTMTGFLALYFMRYRIGFDIGLVMSKGILLSYLSVICILPILLSLFAPLIEKTRHRSLVPNMAFMSKLYTKGRWLFLGLFMTLLVIAYLLQRQATYSYGSNQYAHETSRLTVDQQAITETFGPFEPIVLLVEWDELASEIALTETLLSHPAILYVDTYVSAIDPVLPKDVMPPEIVDRYYQSSILRFTLYTTVVEENQAMYDLDRFIREETAEHYETYYVLGVVPSIADIRDTVQTDGVMVTTVSVIAIAFILMLIFKSLIIPIILVGVIQTAIWINFSIITLQDIQPVYIGYLVVFALLLGATIDYAVLLTHRYMEYRQSLDKPEALKKALEKSSSPIIISALVLASAGFSEVVFSELQVVQEIGMLIGRGTLISLAMVLICLPSILVLFDGLIRKTTYHKMR